MCTEYTCSCVLLIGFYYKKAGTGVRCCIDARQTLRVHSPGGSTSASNDVMAAVLKVWRQIEYPTPLVDAYLFEKDPAKFHPDPIWNEGCLNRNNNRTMRTSSDMRFVPDLKVFFLTYKVINGPLVFTYDRQTFKADLCTRAVATEGISVYIRSQNQAR